MIYNNPKIHIPSWDTIAGVSVSTLSDFIQKHFEIDEDNAKSGDFKVFIKNNSQWNYDDMRIFDKLIETNIVESTQDKFDGCHYLTAKGLVLLSNVITRPKIKFDNLNCQFEEVLRNIKHPKIDPIYIDSIWLYDRFMRKGKYVTGICGQINLASRKEAYWRDSNIVISHLYSKHPKFPKRTGKTDLINFYVNQILIPGFSNRIFDNMRYTTWHFGMNYSMLEENNIPTQRIYTAENGVYYEEITLDYPNRKNTKQDGEELAIETDNALYHICNDEFEYSFCKPF